jgi:hypothetical protein
LAGAAQPRAAVLEHDVIELGVHRVSWKLLVDASKLGVSRAAAIGQVPDLRPYSSPIERGFERRKCIGRGGREIMTRAPEVQRASTVDQEHAHVRTSASGDDPWFEQSLDKSLKLIGRRENIGSQGGDLSAPRL